MFDYATSEYAVIGCVLIDGRCLSVVRETLPSAAFFASDKCSRAYESVCALADRQKPIDPVTVGHTAGLDNDFLALAEILAYKLCALPPEDAVEKVRLLFATAGICTVNANGNLAGGNVVRCFSALRITDKSALNCDNVH